MKTVNIIYALFPEKCTWSQGLIGNRAWDLAWRSIYAPVYMQVSLQVEDPVLTRVRTHIKELRNEDYHEED